jgi:mannose-6-phosphate isomerase-like protein (cupin superfamily)
MFPNATPFDLHETVVQLRDDRAAEPTSRAASNDPGLWTVGLFHANTSADLHSDVWERHVDGNEVLCALSGAIEVRVRDEDDADRVVATLHAGQAFVVPVATWHRLRVVEAAQLLSVTPRAGTQHERMSDTSAPRTDLTD